MRDNRQTTCHSPPHDHETELAALMLWIGDSHGKWIAEYASRFIE
jgi:hypothetical protein